MIYGCIDIAAFASLGVFVTVPDAGEDTNSEFENHLVNAAPFILNAIGEDVTYYPSKLTGDSIVGGDIIAFASWGIFGRAGAGRSIKAEVRREPPRGLDGAPHGVSSVTTIAVANSTTIGIDSAEIDTAADMVAVADRHGKTARRRRVTKINWHDGAMMSLEVR